MPSGSVVKNPPAMLEPQEMQVLSLGQEDPRKRTHQPTPLLLLGEAHEQRSLEGYSPQGHKESEGHKHNWSHLAE